LTPLVPNIVVDTNVVVSAFIARSEQAVARRAFRLARTRFRLCLSAELDAEWERVLRRPGFARHGATAEGVALFLGTIGGKAAWFEPTVRVADCRDPDDNKVMELALAAGAEVILSGDADLLALHPWRGVPVLAPAAFLGQFG
jgi:putative PIN family toxin of toxin-antitoxin system